MGVLTLAGLICGAPQYGSGVQPTQSRPAKQVGGSTSVQCRTEYTTIWDTQYQEKETQECVTKYDNVCKTIFEKKCPTVYKNVCVDKYNTEYEPYTETECS